MQIQGPVAAIGHECEQVLRSLPCWFGIEKALVKYAQDAEHFPTFVAQSEDRFLGFVTVRQHFETSWEIHCIAVHASVRGMGIGGGLLRHTEEWLRERGGRIVQVKTIAASHPSPEYAETRRFYESHSYIPLEVFAELWSPKHPCLQLVKCLSTEVKACVR